MSAEHGDSLPATGTERLLEISDAVLETAIIEQQASLELSERALAQAREHCDRQRRRLRELENERSRRWSLSQGMEAPETGAKTRRKRSTTGQDALLGRDGIDPEWPLHRFRFLSLQRQEIVLQNTGNRETQVIRFADPQSGAVLEAHTFGEARGYHESGYKQGKPNDPLQRQEIWFVGEQRPGRLRMDQLFVEQDLEEA